MGISLKGILGTVAPILAGAIPGPLGGIAKKILADAIGKPDASDAEIEKALATNNPEILAQLRAAEQAFQLELEKNGIKLEEVAAADRASAREMQIAVRSRTPSVLAAVMVIGWIGLITFLAFRDVPAANRDIIVAAIGVFSAQLVTIYSYYFGSSAGSRNKEETIRRLTT